jgi:hypothetical protein
MDAEERAKGGKERPKRREEFYQLDKEYQPYLS